MGFDLRSPLRKQSSVGALCPSNDEHRELVEFASDWQVKVVVCPDDVRTKLVWPKLFSCAAVDEM